MSIPRERANPELPEFQDRWVGLHLQKSKYKESLYERYRFCNKYISGKVVLDLPCGVGWGTSLLKKAKEVYSMDISLEAIEYAVRHYFKKNFHFVVGNMTQIPFRPSYFDIVICLEGYEHIEKSEGLLFLEEVKKVLKPNGYLFVTVPLLIEGRHSGNPYHLYEYKEKEIIDILLNKFSLVLLEKIQGPDTKEIRFVGQNSQE